MPEERKNGYYATYYAKRQQIGLCIKCDQKAANGRYCSECFKKMSANQKRRRNQNKANGLCCVCGQPSNSGTECGRCSDHRKQKFADKQKPGVCTQCHKRPAKIGKKICVQCSTVAAERYSQSGEADRRKKKRAEQRKIVLDHYGGRCVCCGEDIPILLNIDHVENNGGDHRRRVGNSERVYAEIILNYFPSEYQILCYNCNMGKHLNGGVCPHKKGVFGV